MKVTDVISLRPVYKVLRTVGVAGSFVNDKGEQIDFKGDRVIVGSLNRENPFCALNQIKIFKASPELLPIADDSYIAPYFDEFGRLSGCEILEGQLDDEKFISEVEKVKPDKKPM